MSNVQLTFPAGRDTSEDRHVDAGDDGLTLNPTDVDRMLARQRQLSAAEQRLLQAIEEVADEWDRLPHA